MNVLITGGTGFIGRALVEELLGNGHQPIVLSRNPEAHKDLPAGVQAHAWDAKTPQGWGHLIEETDAVVNLAGESLSGTSFFPSRWTPERKVSILESRLNAGAALNKAIEAAQRKPSVLVQSSAIGFYGVLADQAVIEADDPGKGFLAETVSKWEKVTEPVEKLGVRRAVIRTGIALSPDDGALMRILLPYKLFVGGPFGSGKQWYSWIHISDVVRAIRFIIETETAAGVFNLTAPNPLPNKDFGASLGKVMRRPSLIPLPGFVMRLMFGEVATVVLDGQRVLPDRLIDFGFEFRFPTAQAAFRDLLA
ncbi:MAG: TIGR01777 family protein [Chloroflexi bacterium]|nr:TIGR01777 family protein [Chloroflexota bacterium]